MSEELRSFLRQIYQGVTPQTAEAFVGNEDMMNKIVGLSNAAFRAGPEAFFDALTGLVEDWARDHMKTVICARHATDPASTSDVIFQFLDNLRFLSVSILEAIYANFNEHFLASFDMSLYTINMSIVNETVFRDPAVQSIVSRSSFHKSKLFKSRDSEMRAQSQKWKRGKNAIRDFFALVNAEAAARTELRAAHREMHAALGYECRGFLGECTLVPTNSPGKALVQKTALDGVMTEKCARHCCINCCPCNDFLVCSDEVCAEQTNSAILPYQKSLCTLLGHTQRRRTFFRERHLRGGGDWEGHTLPENRIFECDAAAVVEAIDRNMNSTEEKKKRKKKKKKERATEFEEEEPHNMSELTKKLKAFEGSEFPRFEDVTKEENELLEFEHTLLSMNVHTNRIKPIHTDSYLK